MQISATASSSRAITGWRAYANSVSVATGGATGTGPATTYTVVGDPQNSQTGQRHFYSDQSGVIRFNASGAAGATDNPLQ